MTIARFDDGAASVQVTYNDLTLRALSLTAEVLRGSLTLDIRRQGGQTRTFVLPVGVHVLSDLPPNLDLGRDPETNEPTVTRGNVTASLMWAA